MTGGTAVAEKILVVDDEANLRGLICYNLQQAGYTTLEAADGWSAVDMARKERPDLIVLDLMLPGRDGLEVCRILKEQKDMAGIAIIMLTAKTDEIDKILGLELGADDYMTKPFSPRELTARIKAVLRRSHREPAEGGQLAVGRLRFHLSGHKAYIDNEKLELTPKEYELLKLFVANVGKAFSREELLEKVWGYEYYGDTRTVDVHVRHLRIKMAMDAELAEAIETVRGVGYRFRSS